MASAFLRCGLSKRVPSLDFPDDIELCDKRKESIEPFSLSVNGLVAYKVILRIKNRFGISDRDLGAALEIELDRADHGS